MLCSQVFSFLFFSRFGPRGMGAPRRWEPPAAPSSSVLSQKTDRSLENKTYIQKIIWENYGGQDKLQFDTYSGWQWNSNGFESDQMKLLSWKCLWKNSILLCVWWCVEDLVCFIHFPKVHGNDFEFCKLKQNSASVLSRQGIVLISHFLVVWICWPLSGWEGH